jgi:hypothetical protein
MSSNSLALCYNFCICYYWDMICQKFAFLLCLIIVDCSCCTGVSWILGSKGAAARRTRNIYFLVLIVLPVFGCIFDNFQSAKIMQII